MRTSRLVSRSLLGRLAVEASLAPTRQEGDWHVYRPGSTDTIRVEYSLDDGRTYRRVMAKELAKHGIVMTPAVAL